MDAPVKPKLLNQKTGNEYKKGEGNSVLFTQLGCDHGVDKFFVQANVWCVDDDNWIKMLVWHYLRFHEGLAAKDLGKDIQDTTVAAINKEKELIANVAEAKRRAEKGSWSN